MIVGIFPHNVTYWTTKPDGFGGYIFSEPVLVRAYWQDKAEEYFDGNGERVAAKHIVLSPDYIPPKSYIVKGEYLNVQNPALLRKAKMVIGILEYPGIHGDTVIYKAYVNERR